MRVDQKLSGNRVRRTSHLPRSSYWRDYGLDRAAQIQVELPSLGPLDCFVRSSEWPSEEDSGDIASRTTICKLQRGPVVVGFMQFVEYDLHGVSRWAALEGMDAISSSAHECADLVTTLFRDEDTFFELFERGPLLEFTTAWRHPSYPDAVCWAEVANSCWLLNLAVSQSHCSRPALWSTKRTSAFTTSMTLMTGGPSTTTSHSCSSAG